MKRRQRETTAGETTAGSEESLDAIIAAAKEEGKIESVGMPDSWANWGLTWKGIEEEYGIGHSDTDMSSAEELPDVCNRRRTWNKKISEMLDRPLTTGCGTGSCNAV